MTIHVKPLRRTLAAAFLLLAVLPALHAAEPDAQQILRDARAMQASQQRTLNGHLRVESTGRIIPFTLVLSGDTIQYQFKDRAVILKLGDAGSQLFEAQDGDLHKVTPARYDKPVEGTDITYEDLSLKFLYWPKARIDGSDSLDFQDCWKLHLEPGNQPSAYSAVELWVDKKAKSFLQGEGYDHQGKLVKRFKAFAFQHDPQGGMMLKKMRIETIAGGKDQSITYLEIEK